MFNEFITIFKKQGYEKVGMNEVSLHCQSQSVWNHASFHSCHSRLFLIFFVGSFCFNFFCVLLDMYNNIYSVLIIMPKCSNTVYSVLVKTP